MGEIKAGDMAPDFALPSTAGEFRLYSELEKGPVVLYFYPMDFTAGCTAEACEFRDMNSDFAKMGAQIVGISGDSAEKHSRFAGEYKLPFTLLSDTGGSIRALYGVKPSLGIIPGRVTFVISPERKIVARISTQLHPRKHVRDALTALQR